MRQTIILLLVFVPFYSVTFYIIGGSEQGLLGVLIGLFNVVVPLFIQWLYLKKAGLSMKGIKVLNSIVFEATGSREQVLELCLESIRDINKGSVGLLNKEKGRFTVHVGADMRTWGDEIEFEIKDVGNDYCKVEITSRPKIRTTVIDYGKNKEHILKIQNYLLSRLDIKNLQQL